MSLIAGFAVMAKLSVWLGLLLMAAASIAYVWDFREGLKDRKKPKPPRIEQWPPR